MNIRDNTRWGALAAGVGLSLTLALTGCSSGGAGNAASVDLDESSTLVIADKSQPLTGFDPIMAQSQDAKVMVAQFYEGLLSLAPDGITLQPGLATDWKQLSPTSYEFTLRPGVTFHDGSPLTVDDVVFSLERIVDPAQSSPYASLYDLASVKAVGEDLVQVRLKHPQASLLRLLAQPWSGGIVDQEWITSQTDDELKTRENGTGPYKLDEFREGELIKTSGYEGYWDKPKPYITKVDYRVMPDESTRVQAIQSGTVHMTQVQIPKNTEVLEQQGIEVGESFQVGAYWLALNMTDGPLADERVRQALNLGIDREQLIEIGSQGAGVVSGVIPSGDPLGTPADDTLPYYEHDPAQAEKLLAEAGATDLTLTLAVRADSAEKLATAQLVKEQLAQIGVDVEILQVEWGQLVDNILSGKWNADMVQLTSSLNADPSQYLALWFANGSPTTKVNDPKLWQLMAEAVQRKGLTDDQRIQLYADLNRYVAEKAYTLVPYASVAFWDAWNPAIEGFTSDPSSTRLFLKDARIG